MTFYGYDVNRLPRARRWRASYRRLFASCVRVLCEGSHMAAELRALGCPPEKVRVHHLGVDLQRIEFRPRIWSSEGPLRVLIAAGFREKKGIPYAIAALGRLRRELPLEVTVIGDANGEARNRAEKRRILASIAASGLGDAVRMLGYQPQSVLMEEAYRHHVFLSPSVTASDGDTEGGAPVAILEMAASGMPVVSTTHCDIPEVLPGEVHHLLAPERDVDALAARLRSLAAARSGWPELAVRARAHVEAEYDADTQGRRLAAVYEEVLEDVAASR